MTKDSITTELSSVEGDTIKTAVERITTNLIEHRLTNLDGSKINSTSFEMTPSSIVLSAVGDDHVKYVVYTDNTCTVSLGVIGTNTNYLTISSKKAFHQLLGARSFIYTTPDNIQNNASEKALCSIIAIDEFIYKCISKFIFYSIKN